MTGGTGVPEAEGRGTATTERDRFRRTLLRVLTVQVVTLLLLWLLQSRYGA